MTHQLVIGAGEVGTALAEVLDCDLRDVQPHTGDYDTLHIAFPWSPKFVDLVEAYVIMHNAWQVVVHSTVPVGTCDLNGWVHSPIRGRHPDLAESIRTFTKHLGGETAEDLVDLFDAHGIATQTHTLAATTEAGKLWELATYGVEIAMQKRIHAWCEKQNLDFAEVYTTFGETHNQGWHDFGEPRFIKRLIEHQPGPIGGHCVAQNSPLLGEAWVNDLILPYGPEGTLW